MSLVLAKKNLSVLTATKPAGMKTGERISWFQNNLFLVFNDSGSSFLTIPDGIVYNKAALGICPQRGLFFCDHTIMETINFGS